MGFLYFKFGVLTEGILKLKGMKQLLSFRVVLSFVDKLMASCDNNCGSAYLTFQFSLKPKVFVEKTMYL